MEKVKIIVKHRGYVPFIGPGPVLRPIMISKRKFDILTNAGYEVVEFKEPKKVVEVEPEVEEVVPVVEPEVEEVEVEPEVEEVVEVEPEVEEVVEVEPEEGVYVNDEELSGEAFYEREFLTVSKSKTILEARGVEYNYDDKASELKDLVEMSNPEAK